MNRLDLIIAALQRVELLFEAHGQYPHTLREVNEALAAARELKALKPVAWMLPKYGDVLSAAECQGGGGIYNVPLYALEAALAPPVQEPCKCIDQFWCATFDRCKRNE